MTKALMEPGHNLSDQQWIEDMYGPISVKRSGLVCVAVVPVYIGVCIGIGKDIHEALADLRKDLSAKGSRTELLEKFR